MGNSVTKEEPSLDFRDARRRQRDAFRGALLDTAGRLLTREGPGALSVRRLAAEVNASTKVLYTLFGGKDGLAEALFLEGYERLGAALAAVPRTDDPVEDVIALGHAYIDSALARPHSYAVMFHGALPDYRPTPEVLARTWSTFDTLVEALARARHEGRLGDHDPREAATALWSLVHGAVGLHLAGHLPEPAAVRALVERAARAHLAALAAR